MIYRYYLEAKNRFFLIFLTWFSVSIVCYYYNKILIFFLIDQINYIGLSESNPYFIFSDVTDVFYVTFNLVFFISNQICFLLFVYHILLFFSSGLYRFEYKKLITFLRISFVFGICSIFVLNHVLLPFSWNFFFKFQEQMSLPVVSLFFEANFKEYFNFYINLYYLSLVNFQIFLCVLFFLNSINYKVQSIRMFRKFLYYIFIIFSTLITPPDVFSQLFLSCCFILVYESLIFYNFIFSKAAN